MFSQRLICLNRMKISFCIFLRPYLKKNNHLNTFYFSHHFIPFFCSSNFLVYSTSNSSAISIACCFLSPKNPYTTGVCYRNTKTTSFFISQSLRCINREFEKHDNQRHTYPIFRMRTKEKKKMSSFSQPLTFIVSIDQGSCLGEFSPIWFYNIKQL